VKHGIKFDRPPSIKSLSTQVRNLTGLKPYSRNCSGEAERRQYENDCLTPSIAGWLRFSAYKPAGVNRRVLF
jgi:hypothetical protein